MLQGVREDVAQQHRTAPHRRLPPLQVPPMQSLLLNVHRSVEKETEAFALPKLADVDGWEQQTLAIRKKHCRQHQPRPLKQRALHPAQVPAPAAQRQRVKLHLQAAAAAARLAPPLRAAAPHRRRRQVQALRQVRVPAPPAHHPRQLLLQVQRQVQVQRYEVSNRTIVIVVITKH